MTKKLNCIQMPDRPTSVQVLEWDSELMEVSVKWRV